MNAPKRADELEAGNQVECDDGWAVVHHVYVPPDGPDCLINFEDGTMTAEPRDLMVPLKSDPE